MLRKILSGSEWSDILDLVSPSVFKVLPLNDMQRQARQLAGNYMRGSRFDDARSSRAARLADSKLDVALVDTLGDTPTEPEDGRELLRLYFHQIYSGETALLDLRHEHFARGQGALQWNPAAFYVTWDEAFIDAIRRLYVGFYADDDATFRAALDELNLSAAEDIFREHFGTGEQTAVSFDLDHFRSTFHDTFVRCRDADAQLHPNFIPLGIYLATLYEHLDALGGTHDVRGAFESVR